MKKFDDFKAYYIALSSIAISTPLVCYLGVINKYNQADQLELLNKAMNITTTSESILGLAFIGGLIAESVINNKNKIKNLIKQR